MLYMQRQERPRSITATDLYLISIHFIFPAVDRHQTHSDLQSTRIYNLDYYH
jgi:hypothetical protein